MKTTKWYPWLVISLCAFFLFYKYVLQVSPSVMTSNLMHVFQVSGAGLGNLAATYFYAYLVMQLFAGPLLDRYSPKMLMALAVWTCATGVFVFANAHQLFLAEVARAMMGAGAAFATVSYMKMSSMWFRQNQVALVDGLLATAAMAGALCGQVPLTILVSHLWWRSALVCCAVFGLVLAFLMMFFVHEKSEEHLGAVQERFQLTAALGLFKSAKNWWLTLYSGLAFTPLAVLGGLWGNPFFEQVRHFTAEQSASFTSLMFVGLAVGAPVFGFFAGRFGRLTMMMVGSTLALFSLTLAVYGDGPLFALGALLFLFGFGTGAFMSCYSLGKELNSVRLAACVVALINTGDAFFGSFTEPLVGKFLDLSSHGKMLHGVHVFSAHDFHLAFTLLPLYLLGALFCLWKLKRAA